MYDKLLQQVLEHEGGAAYTNHPNDPGGATKYGISLRLLRAEKIDIDHDGDVDADDVKALTYQDAYQLYHRLFWSPGKCEVLGYNVGGKAFDTAVNVGLPRCGRLLQQTCAACGRPVIVDGVVGPTTIATIKAIDEQKFLSKFCELQKQFYLDLVANKPSLAVFKRGWLKRAAWTPV